MQRYLDTAYMVKIVLLFTVKPWSLEFFYTEMLLYGLALQLGLQPPMS